MSLRNRFARLALVVLALSLLSSAAGAENKARSLEFGGFLTYLHYDGDTGLAYDWGTSLLAGYNFTKKHGIETEWSFRTATPQRGESFSNQISIFRVGYTKNFYPKEKLVSLFRMGVGRWANQPEKDPAVEDPLRTENQQHFLVYLGGGVRFFVKEWFAIRLDGSLDLINKSGGILKSQTEGVGSLGVVFLLGGRDEEASPAADEEKAKEEKPKKEKKAKEEKPRKEDKPEEAKPEGAKPEDGAKPPLP